MGPPPDSFEKRQRERRKQQKREEKRQRKKRRQASAKETPIYYTLRRGEAEHRVDTDVWLCAIDLALVQGWMPSKEEAIAAANSGTYVRPGGLSMTDDDARNLGESIEAELPGVSDDQLPLENHAFGEEHTEELLSRRIEGERLAEEEARAARELLSGTPKGDAQQLAIFLKGGAFEVENA